jgi:pyruvate formate lyase activating enzyme
VLAYLRPFLDLYKVDLKCLDDRHYRQLGGRLQPILDSLRRIYEMGFWLEVVTLVVPGFNDSDEELQGIAGYLAGISRDIPWHVTAFRPAYRMEGPPATQPATLVRAADIGSQAGLRYVYAGNLPGQVGDLENTRCPKCRRLLVERRGFRVVRNELDASGICPACRTPIPGRWKVG